MIRYALPLAAALAMTASSGDAAQPEPDANGAGERADGCHYLL